MVHSLVEPLVSGDILEPVAAADGGEGHRLVHLLAAVQNGGHGDVGLVPVAGHLKTDGDQLVTGCHSLGRCVGQTDGELLLLFPGTVGGECRFIAHIGQVVGVEIHHQTGIGGGLLGRDHHRHGAVIGHRDPGLHAGALGSSGVHAEHRQHQHHAKKQ